jgi:hypothetical protein
MGRLSGFGRRFVKPLLVGMAGLMEKEGLLF